MNKAVVLGVDFGRKDLKAHLLANGQEHKYLAPSLAVVAPAAADELGDPLERITYGSRTWLVGNRAQVESPDAVWRTVGAKTEGDALEELKIRWMGVLAWVSTLVDLADWPLVVVTSAPDSEYDRVMESLKTALAGVWHFQLGAPVQTARARAAGITGGEDWLTVRVDPGSIRVARESTAPLWGHIFAPTGDLVEADANPLVWSRGGRPGQEELFPARTLTLGVGFRDWNVAVTEGGKRLESRSGTRGVSEVYGALWEAITGPQVGYSLRSRGELDQIVQGRHPIWTKRDAAQLDAVIRQAIRSKGSALLNEAMEWAGDLDGYHHVLAAGGGCLMLQDLVRNRIPSVRFAAQGDSARGLAYAGAREARLLR